MMSDLESVFEHAYQLVRERKIIPYPFANTYLILLYTLEEVDAFLTYREHDPYDVFKQPIDNPGAKALLGDEFFGRSRCVFRDDTTIILYVPTAIHHNAGRLIQETGVICSDALLHTASYTGTEFSTSWVSLSHAIGYLQNIVLGFINNDTGNQMATVHPLVKQFDARLSHDQVAQAMKGMSPLECQQALYRQNIERQNSVVMPKLQSWMSTTYYQ